MSEDRLKGLLGETCDNLVKALSEIERLRGLVKYHCEQQMNGWKKERELKHEIAVLKEEIQELKDTVNLRDSWIDELEKKKVADQG